MTKLYQFTPSQTSFLPFRKKKFVKEPGVVTEKYVLEIFGKL